MSKFYLEDLHHHIAQNPRLRRLCIWEVLWIIFGIRKDTDKGKLCKAEIARIPRNWDWIR
jgi:hypothetical protein